MGSWKLHRPVCTLASIFVLLLALSERASPQPPNAPGQPTKTARTSTASQPVPPINVTVAGPQRTAEEIAKERQDREREIRAQERVSSMTGAIFGVGFVQFLATGAALAYTARAANAAKRSAQIAETTMQVTQRAYVLFTDWRAESPNVFGANHRLMFTIQHVGDTPAVITSRSAALVISDQQRIPEANLPDAFRGDHVLSPQASITHDVAGVGELDQADSRRVEAGEMFLFVSQRVRYRDVFRRDHFIEEVARLRVVDGEWEFPSADRRTQTDQLTALATSGRANRLIQRGLHGLGTPHVQRGG